MFDDPIEYPQPPEMAATDQQLRAESFTYSPAMERLAAMVEAGKLEPTPDQRMSLFFYSGAKSAARAAGRDVSGARR